jgi:rfaE bifunctional protein nucleotidyltransferase chain/domain
MLYKINDFLSIRSGLLNLVFTIGCFDIIHRVHIEYLNQAKSIGDYLIIGLNSDSSTKRIKGETRPVNNEVDRAFVLSNLKCVDAVVIFNEDTPYNLIKLIKPDYLVKGGDWKEDQIIGSDIVKEYGGRVISLSFVNSYSTTNIIEKIKKQ